MLLALCLAAAPASAQQATTEVPNYWGLTPTGLGPGDEFRLLFVSSTERDASSTSIGTYNTWIQNLAANGHADIQAYSSTFRVVGSTRAVDARDNTETTGTGVPIYWLNGDQVADDYADFYDGSWDQEALMRTESGSTVSAGAGTTVTVTGVWTGSAHDGTEGTGGGFSNALGSNRGVTVGRPNRSGLQYGPLWSIDSVTRNGSAELYGLSGIFRVPLPPPTMLTVTPGDGRVKVCFHAVGATGYTVQWRSASQQFSLKRQKTVFETSETRDCGPGTVSTAIPDLDNGRTYWFRVQSTREWWDDKKGLQSEESDWSDEVSGTPAAVPAVPANVVLTPGDKQLAVDWDPVAGADGYSVEWRQDGYFRELDTTTNSATITGLQNGRSYGVRVLAENVSGRSAWSAVARGAPGQPTATFRSVPVSHDGQNAVRFQVGFSHEMGSGEQSLRDESFTVDDGDVTETRPVDGSNKLWEITVQPDSREEMTIILPGRDCGETGAVCTDEDTPRPLTNSPLATVAGPPDESPVVSVADASATEGNAVEFTVSLSTAGSEQVTARYATSSGTAASGTDFTAASGTVTFAAGETSKAVSVSSTDDSVDEEDETFTLTLASPTNATLGDATATGTILDDDDASPPLTASFSGMPASHTGAQFTFGLAFSEEVEVGYQTLRDEAFAVTGGEVRKAKRQQQGSNQAWNITVEPTSANDTVIITLPETTDCDAVDAICTGDKRPLSHELSATVIDAASASAGDAANGDIEDDALGDADGLTPEEATQALFGERRLSEAQLTALDRLGNRNGSYDLGDVLSWIERCRRGEARCGGTSTDSGPASSAALLGVAAGGRRRTSRQPKRGDSGHRGSLPIRGMRRRARMTGSALAMLLAATMAWSCTDGSVGPTAAEQDPGFLTIEWTGPAAARDIGVLIELEGPGIETVRAPGLDLYESSAPGRHQVVVAGSLRAGPLMQFRVPDRGQLPLYRVRVVQVTGEDYALRDPGEYRAVITLH